MKGLLNRLLKLLYFIIGGFFILFIGWYVNIFVIFPFKLIYIVVYWLLFGKFKDGLIISLIEQPMEDFEELYELIFKEEL